VAQSGYRIIDEPTGGRLGDYAVKPMWPLLGLMFGGGLLAWPWFIFNGFALSSATKRREIAWAIAGALGPPLLIAGGIWGLIALGVPDGGGRYMVLVGIGWKLLAAYMIHGTQERSAELHMHFGGETRSGFIPLIVGFAGRTALLSALGDSPLLIVGLSGFL
jgi:hypothetical protein